MKKKSKFSKMSKSQLLQRVTAVDDFIDFMREEIAYVVKSSGDSLRDETCVYYLGVRKTVDIIEFLIS